MPMTLYTKASEVKLMQTLSEIRDESDGWRAIHFHMSDLLEQYKSEYQIKIALNLINDLLKSHQGGVFLMSDYSIIVLSFELEQPLQEKLIFQLRYLYMDDPLAYTDTGQENPDFCTAYKLPRDWKAFHELCSRRMAIFTRKPPVIEKQADEPQEAEERTSYEKNTFSASRMAAIERTLDRADLHKTIRRQPVCALLPDMKIRRVFDELYININHLRWMLKSDVDFLSNRWLFKYLTRILDERVIELIRHNPAVYVSQPVSINLNVETLLSSWFAELDSVISPAAKTSIVIEVSILDVFADMAAFQLARREVQKLGYRICLDGISTEGFSIIDRERLGADLIKLQWNADLEGDLEKRENIEMADAIRRAGTNRVILCRCDNLNAVEYGHALGISLFQGRYIDSLINPTSKVEN